jgi:hypothetical protein
MIGALIFALLHLKAYSIGPLELIKRIYLAKTYGI